MAKVQLTPALRADYDRLFETCVVRPQRAAIVDSLTDKLAANKARYETVAGPLGLPWAFVAVIHNMEASQSFTCHLHNGDPLTARTVQVPSGRPKSGQPPFTWEGSCQDALSMKGYKPGMSWTIAETLYRLEGYNGWGYRLHHPDVLTPYLWSFSNHYQSGKYVADGTWSQTAQSKQCGAAVLLRRMVEKKLFSFADQPLPAPDQAPLVVPYAMTKSNDPEIVQRALALQAWLNTHTGIFVKLDGVPGRATSDAFRLVTGAFLPGDPKG